MFWDFFNKVHQLPLQRAEATDAWWSDDEKEETEWLVMQWWRDCPLDHKPTMEARVPKENLTFEQQKEGIHWVVKPTAEWIKVLEERYGKYLGTVTYDGAPAEQMLTCDCGVEIVIPHEKVDYDQKPKCPICGTQLWYPEEGPDVETVCIFTNGSIAYSHYGRGPGFSYRKHTSLKGAPDDTGQLFDYFAKLNRPPPERPMEYPQFDE